MQHPDRLFVVLLQVFPPTSPVSLWKHLQSPNCPDLTFATFKFLMHNIKSEANKVFRMHCWDLFSILMTIQCPEKYSPTLYFFDNIESQWIYSNTLNTLLSKWEQTTKMDGESFTEEETVKKKITNWLYFLPVPSEHTIYIYIYIHSVETTVYNVGKSCLQNYNTTGSNWMSLCVSAGVFRFTQSASLI